MYSEEIIQKIIDCGIMPTAFVYGLDETVMLAKTLWQNGIHVIELLQRTEKAAQAIDAVKSAVPEMVVGAGTVTSLEKAKTAVLAGADYLVSPFYNQRLVDWCREQEKLIIPGCATITEISQGYDSGLRLFKYFPVKQLGGAEVIRQISEIYSDARYVVTGGINFQDVFEYAPIESIAAIGTVCMMPQELISSHNWEKIAVLTRKAVAASLGLELAYVAREAKGFKELLEMMHIFSMGRSAIPEVPQRLRELIQERPVGIYTNSVSRTLAYFKMRGLDATVVAEDVLGPIVADMEFPGFCEPVRLIARSASYRA